MAMVMNIIINIIIIIPFLFRNEKVGHEPGVRTPQRS